VREQITLCRGLATRSRLIGRIGAMNWLLRFTDSIVVSSGISAVSAPRMMGADMTVALGRKTYLFARSDLQIREGTDDESHIGSLPFD
jgi:hypothetical protein